MDRRRMAIALAAAAALAFLIIPAFGRLPSDSSAVVAAARRCGASPDRPACLARLAADLLAGQSLTRVLSSLHAAVADPAVSNVCHVLGHYLGQAEYRRTGDLAAALGRCDDFCYGSCYHGAAEAYVIDRIAPGGYAADDTALAAVARSVTDCRTASCEERVDTIHGVGHALMFLTANDLPRSLRLCDLASNPTACHIGVFMSNYQSLEDDTHPSRYIRRDDPTFPCRELEPRYREACYLNQAQFFVTDDILGNIALCQSFPFEFRERCLLEMAKHSAQQGSDVAAMHAACGVVPSSHRQFCIESIIVNLHGKSGHDVRDMSALCRVAEPEHKRGCYGRMRTVLGNQLGDAVGRRSVCATMTGEEQFYAEWCREN